MNYDSKHSEIVGPKEWYDQVADQYKNSHSHLDSFYHVDFLRYLPRKAQFDLIDLGAGDGRMFKELNPIPHNQYVVVDISKAMLSRHPRGPKHVIADLEKKFPLEDECFDVAVCFFTLEHLENIDQFMEECYRILRNDWTLFIGHFFQRKLFEWTANNKYFKIKQYKRTTEDIQQSAEQAFFHVEVFPLYDKKDHTGDLIICRKW